MMSASQPYFSQSNKKALRNPWVVGWLALLVLVVGVNAAFIVTAFVTSPGLVDENYYEKGQQHEQQVRTKIAKRQRLGWQVEFDLPDSILLNKKTPLGLNLRNRDGIRISADEVTVSVYRPSDVSADFKQGAPRLSAGYFETDLVFPLKGIWDLTAVVRSGDDQLDFTQRIYVTAP